jgi:hypothetical protein
VDGRVVFSDVVGGDLRSEFVQTLCLSKVRTEDMLTSLPKHCIMKLQRTRVYEKILRTFVLAVNGRKLPALLSSLFKP